MYSPLPSGVDLARLDDLLQNKFWKEADYETYLIICNVMRRSRLTGLDLEDFNCLPSAELLAIERLWSTGSGGRFGFNAQFTQLQLVNNDAYRFAAAIGWIAHGNWIAYSDVSWSQGAPLGHLPIGGRGGFCGGIGNKTQGKGLLGYYGTVFGIASSAVTDVFQQGGWDRFWKRLGDDLKLDNGFSKAWVYQRLLLLKRFAECRGTPVQNS